MAILSNLIPLLHFSYEIRAALFFIIISSIFLFLIWLIPWLFGKNIGISFYKKHQVFIFLPLSVLAAIYAYWIVFVSHKYGVASWESEAPQDYNIIVPHLDAGIYRLTIIADESQCARESYMDSCKFFKTLYKNKCMIAPNNVEVNLSICGRAAYRMPDYIHVDLADLTVEKNTENLQVDISYLKSDEKYRPNIQLTNMPSPILRILHPNYFLKTFFFIAASYFISFVLPVFSTLILISSIRKFFIKNQ